MATATVAVIVIILVGVNQRNAVSWFLKKISPLNTKEMLRLTVGEIYKMSACRRETARRSILHRNVDIQL